ncbi:hypothetical protein [Thiolapillus sp.]|uniref:hypothetical protein n=3 Tax=Thiolapillus sp. TaxID=2017437 RepID=UPI003AF93356
MADNLAGCSPVTRIWLLMSQFTEPEPPFDIERLLPEAVAAILELQDCRVPCDYIPKRSYPLFRTRQILNDWLTQNLEEA